MNVWGYGDVLERETPGVFAMVIGPDRVWTNRVVVVIIGHSYLPEIGVVYSVSRDLWRKVA